MSLAAKTNQELNNQGSLVLTKILPLFSSLLPMSSINLQILS